MKCENIFAQYYYSELPVIQYPCICNFNVTDRNLKKITIFLELLKIACVQLQLQMCTCFPAI
jgi:hypothetical protein